MSKVAAVLRRQDKLVELYSNGKLVHTETLSGLIDEWWEFKGYSYNLKKSYEGDYWSLERISPYEILGEDDDSVDGGIAVERISLIVE